MRRLSAACIPAYILAMSANFLGDHVAVDAWASPRGISACVAAVHTLPHSAIQRSAILSMARSRLLDDRMHSSQYLHPTMW